MTAALETTGLCRRFGAVKGADQITVRFEAGSVAALIGTNGAGKTTFLNLVTGYLRPDAGRVLLAGRDITGLAPREITRLGVARSFQIPQVFDALTVDENLEVACQVALRHATGAQAETLADVRTLVKHRFSLESSGRLEARTLPGGARKLLDIAMALVSQPRVLVLDEPTSGVSAEEKEPVVRTVIELARRLGAMTLFVEHDMDVVASHADRVLAFFEGRVIADGPPDGVLADPTVRELIVGQAPRERTHA